MRVWFNSDGDYHFGDRAKVYAQAAEDGNLVVLRADAGGHVRVLFPIDPDADQHVHSGKKYELKGRGGREAFVADDTTGHGTVVAALARTPFEFAQFERNGHWNYDALDQGVQGDAQAGLTDIVEQMRGTGQHFDYDAATYTVSPQPRYVAWDSRGLWPGWWGGWYGDGFWYGPRVGFGWRFGRPWWGR